MLIVDLNFIQITGEQEQEEHNESNKQFLRIARSFTV